MEKDIFLGPDSEQLLADTFAILSSKVRAYMLQLGLRKTPRGQPRVTIRRRSSCRHSERGLTMTTRMRTATRRRPPWTAPRRSSLVKCVWRVRRNSRRCEKSEREALD
jgi:hypothetical protein